jgi:hypothetical protein
MAAYVRFYLVLDYDDSGSEASDTEDNQLVIGFATEQLRVFHLNSDYAAIVPILNNFVPPRTNVAYIESAVEQASAAGVAAVVEDEAGTWRWPCLSS